MSWFKNRRMAVKLALAFGVCLLVTCVVGGLALWGMSGMAGANQRLSAHASGLEAIKEVNINVLRASRAVRNAMLDDSVSAIDGRIADIRRYRDAYTQSLATFEQTVETDEARQILEELRKLDTRLRPAQDELVLLARERKIDEAKSKLQAARAIADDVDAQIDRIERSKQQVMEKAVADSATSYTTSSRSMIATIAIALILCAGVALVLTRLITVPLIESRRVLQVVAEGDFSQTLDLRTKDELGEMAAALNEAVAKVRTALEDVRASSDTVASAAQQLASAAEEISSGAQEQASSLEETAASLEEITATIKQNADNAQQASQLATGARSTAENGGQVVNDAIAAMDAINESSSRIADIITTIDEIAFQTNLLALNAAVEAARAGEQGRGFAVVAAEVRNLAQRSASAAKEIKALIQDSVKKVTAGSDLVGASGKTLNEIVTSVKRVTDIVAEIAAASREQSGGIEQVNKAVTQMDQVTQANASQTEEMSGTAESLSGEAGKLQTLILQFKLGDARQTSAAGAAPRAMAGTGMRSKTLKHPRAKAGVAKIGMKTPPVEGALALDSEFQEY